MSNKSGVSNQVISLPKGGGALKGLGETFSPDLFTGTGNFSVPIALPPGRNGFQPELNLVYSTGNGNGPCGLGWALSIPGVSRKTSKGVPRYRDAEDTFILSGAEDLVPVAGEFPGPVRYRPRTEGLFALITYHRAGNRWEVRSKDGLTSHYGNSPQNPRADPAVIADPASAGARTFAWKLVETADPFGNRILYEYERDSGEENGHHWDQLYLRRIRYIDYDDAATGDERFLVSVTFDYSLPDERSDHFSEYRAGFEIRTRKRCRQIVVRTHADKERRVRTYKLIYLDERVAAGDLPDTALPPNGVSLLSQVRVIGHDDEQPIEADRLQELPPLEFGYTPFEPEGRKFQPMEGRELPTQSLASPDLELADLFGNGLPDIFQMNGSVRYWRNLGNGTFDMPREMGDAPAGLQLADAGVQLIDANGEGRIDLLVTSGPMAGYFPTRPGGLWDRDFFQRYESAPSFNLEDPELRLVDLDGDGATDAVRSGTRLECFFSDPREGWNETRFVERRNIEHFPNVNFSDPRVKWADISGDGLTDIVLVYDGNVEYWPNLGHGSWSRRLSMRNSPRFPYGYDPKRILMGDVDGDGLADLVYVDHGRVLLWINQSGNGWSDPIEIDGTPPVTDMDAVRLVDMLGTGISGVLWSADATVTGRPHMFFLDFTGALKPYLMNEMNNHMGAVTRVEYAPSTHYYLLDETHPQTRWKTSLPFPVQVVARVEVIDHISRGKLTTEYSYHHGYWDGGEREFRGFGRVDQRDTETPTDFDRPGLHPERDFAAIPSKAFSPPTETRTWFHLGPVGEEFGDWDEIAFNNEHWSADSSVLDRFDTLAEFRDCLPRRVQRDAVRALRGRMLRTELYALDGTDRENRPYTVTEFLYGLREEEVPAEPNEEGRSRIFFPHAVAQRITQWERGDDPMTQLTFSFTDEHDEYGQPRRKTDVACPRGWRTLDEIPHKPFLATQSHTVFAEPVNPSAVYIRDRVARITELEIKNDGTQPLLDLISSTDLQVIGQTLNYYDGEAFLGFSFGKLGEYGAPVRTETLVLTESILEAAYKNSDTPEIPPYLTVSGSPDWTAEYPEAFRESLPQLAGYVFHSGDAAHTRGYFAATTRLAYDFQSGSTDKARGLVMASRAPLGDDTGSQDTSIGYDTFELLPVLVIDPVTLAIHTDYDYRVLQPTEVTDPNGNRTAVAYTPLGLVKSAAVMGKEGEAKGDTREVPGARFEYDLLAFADRGQPISARTVQREHHVNDTDVPLPKRGQTIDTVEYSDGFGRLLQTRTQAEDVFFGDPAFAGNAGLPADQSLSGGDAIGQTLPPGTSPRVVVSGWQIYDNKGRVVEKYEPFFSIGWEFVPPRDDQLGQKAILVYDPRGRVIRTINPDGSEQRVLYGIPGTMAAPNLSDIGHFEPTPWETYTYDANDLASLSFHPSATLPDGTPKPLCDLAPEAHHFTPTSTVVDALGRTIETVERNGQEPADWYVTLSTYDIRGNLLAVTDALERVAFEYLYDFADNAIRIQNLDAGIRRTVLDAAHNEIERRDSKGGLILQTHDRLTRPVRLWARDDDASPVTLRERLEYGDGGSPGQVSTEPNANRALNRLGALYRHFDEAGLLIFESYDFKGNVLEKTRQVIADEPILDVFPDPNDPSPDWRINAFRVDWYPPAGTSLSTHVDGLLDSVKHQSSLTYDALSRTRTLQYPRDQDGERKVLHTRYNRAGALESVVLDDTTYVEHIAYNAKGQRTLIALGNGVMTRYAYDPETFRLVRMRSERYTTLADFTFHPVPSPPRDARKRNLLQDFAYEYDLVGNIVALHDRTPESGILNNPQALQVSDPLLKELLVQGDAQNRSFEYDPLYRLRSAGGRECDHPPEWPPWDSRPRCTDITRTRSYTEHYQYDPLGNILEFKHRIDSGGFTRQFSLADGTNRLQTVRIGTTDHAYDYDENGNLVRENASRYFEWDHSDQMRVFRTQTGAAGTPPDLGDLAEPSVHAHYLYDATGERVKKLVRKQGGQVEVTVYVDGIYESPRIVQGGTVRENNTLHVMDDEARIAMVRVGEAFDGDEASAVKYQLRDHLGSSNVVIDGDGGFIDREEYTPYGETSFGSFARKRYRFTGKERDEESRLCYHGARYYAPWLTKWASPDPNTVTDGSNFYAYTSNNPMRFVDRVGLQKTDQVQESSNIASDQEPITVPGETIVIYGIAPVDPEEISEKIWELELFYTGRPFPFSPPVLTRRERIWVQNNDPEFYEWLIEAEAKQVAYKAAQEQRKLEESIRYMTSLNRPLGVIGVVVVGMATLGTGVMVIGGATLVSTGTGVTAGGGAALSLFGRAGGCGAAAGRTPFINLIEKAAAGSRVALTAIIEGSEALLLQGKGAALVVAAERMAQTPMGRRALNKAHLLISEVLQKHGSKMTAKELNIYKTLQDLFGTLGSPR